MADRLKIKDGDRYGRLSVVSEESPVSRHPHRGFFRMFKLRCDCGGEIITRMNSLRSGRVNSCGCLIAETNIKNAPKITKHGEATGKRPPEYRAWHAIIQRCTNPNFIGWRYYGGRGIRVCEEWRNDYLAFLNHIGRRPSPLHSVDRIDNDGHYELGNVRWATKSEQAFNRRRPAINRAA